MENWRFIKENNDYMVSDHGRIMSLKKPQKKILSSSLLHNGYEAIYIYQKGIHAALHSLRRDGRKRDDPPPVPFHEVNGERGKTEQRAIQLVATETHASRTGTAAYDAAVAPALSAHSSRLHPRPPLRHPAILPAPVRRRGRRTGVQLPERPKGERHSLNYQQFKINKRKEIFKMKDAIIIHCSATRAEQDITAADIESWHRARGFWTIGYHYVIRLDGTIEPGRDVTLDGAHCMGWNKRAIGICYVGGLDKDGRPADTRTDAQRTALIRLVKALRLVFPGVKQVLGHRDTSPDLNGDGVISPNEYMKACPCFDVQKEGF